VTVVQADGRVIDDVTIVVRGELIEAMGPGIPVPADAEVLAADSMLVYPGFIDADGDADFEIPEPDIDRSDVEIWNAPRALQGFMPARRLVDFLTTTGEDAEAQRKEGIVAAAVHPRGAMMGGRGTLLLNRQRAEIPEQMVLTPELGPKFELQAGPGVYPGTLFGVMATFRQTFEDARHRGFALAAHRDDPRGMTAPAFDPDYAVLRQVLDGLAVFFEADRAADILRVVRLAEEYGFRPIIVGGEEAWKVASTLEDRDIPVLVSVDFREPRRWDPADTTAELDPPTEREKEEFVDRWSNAARLAEAGVTIALTSGGSGKILEGARKVVEYGLPEAAALRALTATPAELLDVDWIPRIDQGLPATFVVASGPLFEEDSRVAFTFVEGWKEDGATPRAAGDAESAVAFGGEWEMEIDAQGQVITGTLTIEQEGATFTGTMMMQGMPLQITDGVIDGNSISMTAVMEQGGQTLEIEISGTVEGDQASGDADAGPLGVARWTATRTGPGGAR
jgi:imidazolonepropionase-like amidohydrolase